MRRFEFFRVDRECGLAFFRKFEEGFKPCHTLAVRLGEIDHRGSHGRKHDHFFPCTGNGDVQPSPSAKLIERSEIEGNAPRSVRSVAHGKENDVALVALHVFKVFDKERFFPLICNVFQPVFDERIRKPSFDIVLLRGGEGHDADARTGKFRIFEPSHDVGDQRFRLRLVPLRKSPVVNAVFDESEAHLAFQRVGRRKRTELAPVIHDIGKGDQALVFAPVMPVEVFFGHTQCETVVENAFEIFRVEIFLVHIAGTEKGSRRELFGVADNDGGLRTGERTDGFTGGKLRRFVEHDKIEHVRLCGQVLCHGDGAHQHTGSELFDQLGYLFEKAFDRHAAHIALYDALERENFQTEPPFRRCGGQLRDEFLTDVFLRDLGVLFVEGAELIDLLFEHGRRKLGKNGIGAYICLDEIAVDILSETAENVVGRNCTRFERIGDEREPFVRQFFRDLLIEAPRGEHIHVVYKRARLDAEIVEDILVAVFVRFRADGFREISHAVFESIYGIFQSFEHGDRIAARDRLNAYAVEAVGIVIHENAFAEGVHLHEIFHEFVPFAEVDPAAPVGEVYGEPRVVFHELKIFVDLRDDADIFKFLRLGEFCDGRFSQSLDKCHEHFGTLVIFAPVIQFLFDDGRVGINVDERLEIFEIVSEQSV